jgi:hypothetical protein
LISIGSVLRAKITVETAPAAREMLTKETVWVEVPLGHREFSPIRSAQAAYLSVCPGRF